MTLRCPICGGVRLRGRKYCLVCLDDRVQNRPWKHEDVGALRTAAREMCDVFRVYADVAAEEELVCWRNLIDALDRRHTGPTALDDGWSDEEETTLSYREGLRGRSVPKAHGTKP